MVPCPVTCARVTLTCSDDDEVRCCAVGATLGGGGLGHSRRTLNTKRVGVSGHPTCDTFSVNPDRMRWEGGLVNRWPSSAGRM